MDAINKIIEITDAERRYGARTHETPRLLNRQVVQRRTAPGRTAAPMVAGPAGRRPNARRVISTSASAYSGVSGPERSSQR